MKMRGTLACLSFSMSFSRMIWSSWRRVAKSFLLANQRDCQLRRTARRKPIGLVFWPMVESGWHAVGDDDAEVGHLLAAGHRGALGAGLEALEHRAVLDQGALHHQGVGREVVVVLGVGDGAREGLGQEARGLARHEGEVLHRPGGLAALDRAGD